MPSAMIEPTKVDILHADYVTVFGEGDEPDTHKYVFRVLFKGQKIEDAWRLEMPAPKLEETEHEALMTVAATFLSNILYAAS